MSLNFPHEESKACSHNILPLPGLMSETDPIVDSLQTVSMMIEPEEVI